MAYKLKIQYIVVLDKKVIFAQLKHPLKFMSGQECYQIIWFDVVIIQFY